MESGSTLALMMGMSGSSGVQDHLGVDPTAALEDAEDGHFLCCASTTLTLPVAAEIALIELDLAFDRRLVLDLGGDDFAKPVVEESG